MSLLDGKNKKKIHNRNIEITTYSWDDDHVLVVGEFREQRDVEFVNQLSEQVKPGVYHNMIIELLVSTEAMTIEEVEISLPQLPREDCPAIYNSLDGIKGMQIGRGFSRAIRQMAGGAKGCTHLNTLLLAMAPAVLQGGWINSSWKQKVPQEKDSRQLLDALADSCWTWRKEGPLVTGIKERLGHGSD